MSVDRSCVVPGDTITYRPSGQGAEATGIVRNLAASRVWVMEQGRDITESCPWEYVTGHVPAQPSKAKEAGDTRS